MKTQIITLAAHDDLVSVRDRMSWAKAPRILLVWPPREQVALQPLDLRILQQHARGLGAEIGLVARGGRIGRDARAFGIPVFRSSVEAQRRAWGPRARHGQRRPGPTSGRLARLREMQQQARAVSPRWTSGPVPRMVSLVLAVFSVFALASLFLPRATVVLVPATQEQRLSLTVDVRPQEDAGLLRGSLPAQFATAQVRGSETLPVMTRSGLPGNKATGVVRIQNLTGAPLLVPAGTVVYSLKPGLIRFITLEEVRLDTSANNIMDVSIEAVQAGTDGNLPAKAIEGTEGSLSASVSVTNTEPTVGGTTIEQSVPSEADRDQLRVKLEESLRAQAEAEIQATLQEDDMLLPESLVVQSISNESFDPPPGEPASVLSLTLEATYGVQYLRGTDVRALAGLALDAQTPPDYEPRAGTLRLQVNRISPTSSGQTTQLQLDLQRTLKRRIDLMWANQSVRGVTPAEARRRLAEALPLAAQPEIQMAPSWWPWLPLIPFRIELIAQ